MAWTITQVDRQIDTDGGPTSTFSVSLGAEDADRWLLFGFVYTNNSPLTAFAIDGVDTDPLTAFVVTGASDLMGFRSPILWPTGTTAEVFVDPSGSPTVTGIVIWAITGVTPGASVIALDWNNSTAAGATPTAIALPQGYAPGGKFALGHTQWAPATGFTWSGITERFDEQFGSSANLRWSGGYDAINANTEATSIQPTSAGTNVVGTGFSACTLGEARSLPGLPPLPAADVNMIMR